jgi:phospholipid/cholesterol/gamma-HCH transport system permease protein
MATTVSTPTRRLGTAVDRRLGFLDTLGDQIAFFVRALAWTPCAATARRSPGWSAR